MGLWERLQDKAVQRAQVPIVVGDLRAAQQDLTRAQGVLAAHDLAVRGKAKPTAGDKRKTVSLTERVTQALAGLSATIEMVDVQSMYAPDYEALISAHLTADGDTNLATLLPALMAASCVDEELQDEGKWAEQFTRPVWSEGEFLQLREALMGLNMHVFVGGQGKG